MSILQGLTTEFEGLWSGCNCRDSMHWILQWIVHS